MLLTAVDSCQFSTRALPGSFCKFNTSHIFSHSPFLPTQVVHSVSASIVSYFHTVAFLDTATVWSLLFSHHHLVVCLPFVYLLCIIVNIPTVNVFTLVQHCLSPSYRCYLYQLHFATTTAIPLFSTSSFCSAYSPLTVITSFPRCYLHLRHIATTNSFASVQFCLLVSYPNHTFP